MTDYGAYDHNLPCKNPNCSSYGKPHPNCRCYHGLAHGGKVEPFCLSEMPHEEGCEYYADGGEVPAQSPPQPFPQFVEDPGATLGHAAAEQGLLGLLKGLGGSKIQNPEKHEKLLREAKEQHAWRAQPDDVPLPKTAGRKLGDAIADGDFDRATDLVHGEPISAGAGKAALKPILGRMSQGMMTEEPNPHGFRSGVDYLSSAIAGEGKVRRQAREIFGPGKFGDEPSEESREELKKYVDEARENPLELLDVGNSVGHYLPIHGAQVSALAARATNYLNGLRPMASQNAPLDSVKPIDKLQEEKYNRQLGIAQQPLLALKYAKDGTLQHQDVATLRTLYPKLHDKLIENLTPELAKAAENGSIHYRLQRGLSMLMGSPLQSTLKQPVMAAISAANAAPALSPRAAAKPRKVSKSTASTMKKNDAAYATPEQARALEHVSGE